MDPFLSLIFGLIILGFALYLVQKYVPMAGIVKDLLMFVIVIAVLYWLFTTYPIRAHLP